MEGVYCKVHTQHATFDSAPRTTLHLGLHFGKATGVKYKGLNYHS